MVMINKAGALRRQLHNEHLTLDQWVHFCYVMYFVSKHYLYLASILYCQRTTIAAASTVTLFLLEGYVYFGVQTSSYCYCGVAYGRYRLAEEIECDMPCYGDNTQICGGLNRNSVWKIIEDSLVQSLFAVLQENRGS